MKISAIFLLPTGFVIANIVRLFVSRSTPSPFHYQPKITMK